MALETVHTEAAKVMAPRWNSFSPDQNRTEHHAFLQRVLEGSKKVFDACLGSGSDAKALARKGFKVVGNEADPSYHQAATASLEAAALEIPTTQLDWRELEDKQEMKGAFDGVLCVGNSFCYLLDRADHARAIRGFRSILANDGKLVIDERNFASMLENRDAILAGLPQREEIARSHLGMHGHLYGGELFFPYPLEISSDLVRMGMWEYGKDTPLTELHFYPFKRGELLARLTEIFGDNKVKQFSDYKEGQNPNAGFYQYVCER